jgi:hypothetical protein
MDRESIKKSQAAIINKSLFRNLNYLLRLRERMQQVGFPQDDKLYLLVCKAYDAVHALHIETHYLSCDGVGNPRKDEADSKMSPTNEEAGGTGELQEAHLSRPPPDS